MLGAEAGRRRLHKPCAAACGSLQDGWKEMPLSHGDLSINIAILRTLGRSTSEGIIRGESAVGVRISGSHCEPGRAPTSFEPGAGSPVSSAAPLVDQGSDRVRVRGDRGEHWPGTCAAWATGAGARDVFLTGRWGKGGRSRENMHG